MDLNIIIILGLCVVIFLMFFVIYFKDKQADKKFERFDQVLTDAMQENYLLKKKVEELKEMIDSGGKVAPNIDINAIADVIDETIEQRLNVVPTMIDERVEKQIRPLLDQLKELIGSVRK